MPLKKQKGQMYSWVSHMHSHLGGECPHKCGYCYVQRNPYGVSPRWQGKPRLIAGELKISYGGKWLDQKDKTLKTEKTIFIEHMSDLFADGIKDELIKKIINHCWVFPENTYVFQTKNPERAFRFWKGIPTDRSLFPDSFMIGTTIESNRIYEISLAPIPADRYLGILGFKEAGIKTFVTIEPIMDFDVDILVGWLADIKPDFVNIGADSKKCGLPEPLAWKVKRLIEELQKFTEIRNKYNLQRILANSEKA